MQVSWGGLWDPLTPQAALAHPIPTRALSLCQLPALCVPRVPPWRAASCCCSSSTRPTPPRPPCPVPRAGPAPGGGSVDPALLGGLPGPPLTCLYLPVPCPPLPGPGESPPPALGVGARGVPHGPSGICTDLSFLIKLRFVFLPGPSFGLVSPHSASLPPLSIAVLDPPWSLSTPVRLCPHHPPRVPRAPGTARGGLQPPLMSLDGDRSFGGGDRREIKYNLINMQIEGGRGGRSR